MPLIEDKLEVAGGDTITAEVTVATTGSLTGAEVAQLYLTKRPGQWPGEPPVRGDLLITEEFDRHAA